MGSFIADTGPVIWPTAIMGLVALGAAFRYATNGRLAPYRFAIRASVTSVAFGAFGTVTGIRHVLQPIRELAVEKRWIVMIGLSESLTCLIASLFFALLVGVIVTLGGIRFDRLDEPELASLPAEA